MMASNDMVSTVMYWIIWDLADCDLEEVSVSQLVSFPDLERIPLKGAAETMSHIEATTKLVPAFLSSWHQCASKLLFTYIFSKSTDSHGDME